MSNAIANNMKPEVVVNPQMEFHNEGKIGVSMGNMLYTPTQITTQQYNQQGGVTTFQAQPPSLDTSVSRNMLIEWTFQCDFLITPPAVVNPVMGIQPGVTDAPRYMPASQVMQTISANINNTTVSLNTNYVVNPFSRCNMTNQKTSFDMSLAPSAMDEFQNYDDAWLPTKIAGGGIGTGLIGITSDPLTSFGEAEGKYSAPRGSWYLEGYGLVNPGTNLIDPALIPVSATQYTLRVIFKTLEPLWVSPFDAVGDDNSLIGLSNLTLTCNFQTNLDRVWAKNKGMSARLLQGTVDLQTTTIVGTPTLHVTYMTPNSALTIPPVCVYKYTQVDTYQTNGTGPISAAGIAGDTQVITSANIQLTTIPNRIIIWCERATQNKTIYTSDTFLQITNLQIQFDNQSGILSTASEQDLYLMSYKNGSQMSWTQWRRTVGSVFILDICKNLALTKADEAPGLTCNKQLQVKATVRNINSLNVGLDGGSMANITLWFAVLSTGVMTIERGSALLQPAILTRTDILNAISQPARSIMAYPQNYYGGKLGGVDKFLAKGASALRYAKKHKLASKAIGIGALAGYAVNPSLAAAAMLAGAGRHGSGGAMVGGQMVKKRKLLEIANQSHQDQEQEQQEYDYENAYDDEDE